MADQEYLPPARGIRFGIVTRAGWTWCLGCAEAHPDGWLSDHPDYTAKPGDRCYVYGGDLTGHDGGVIDHTDDRARCCRVCGRDLGADAVAAQLAHDQQQAGWARIARDVTHEIVGGQVCPFPLAIRCY